MKKVLLLTLSSVLASQVAEAQTRTVTGRVTERATGQGLPGVTVLARGTSVGTSTNADGNFSLNVPTSATALTFSFIGYTTIERPIGDATVIDVALESSTRALGEVVVTALGLETSRDRLGTAQTTVQGSALVSSGESSPITALSGKSPGVLITRSSGDPGASANIQIRGASTITGNLQPLIVVDGIPISNSSIGENTPGSGGGILASGGGAASNQIGGAVQQSRLNDINPDDIASMEVLRGAAAAALWGTRAANGVLVITTKKGRNADKLNFSYRTSYSIDQINRTPDLQQRFGQGVNGQFLQGNTRSWGDRIADRAGGTDTYVTAPGQFFTRVEEADGTFRFIDLYGGFITFPDGTQRYVIPSPGSYLADRTTQVDPVHGGKNSRDTFDHSDEVFDRGYSWDNIATLSGGDQRGNFYLSLGNTHTEGIALRNSDNDRTTARVNVARQLTPKFRAGVNTTYARTLSNRVQQGSNSSGIFLGGLRTPADFDNSRYVGDYTDPQGNIFLGRQSSYRNPLGNSTNPGFDNPFWTIDNVRDQTLVQRLIGSLELTYDPTSWLNIINRTGVDTYADRRSTVYPIGSGQAPTGQISQSTIQETQVNNDLIVRATHDFTDALGGTLLLGTNINVRRGDQVGANATNFINPFSPPQLDNTLADSRQPFNLLVEQRTAAAYAQVDLAFLDQLFLSGTGRAETASTFGPETSSVFFFPAVTAAWQFTKLAPLAENKILNFGKVRLALGSVGVQPTPYLTRTYYAPADASVVTDGWGTSLDASNYGGGFVRSSVQGNPVIKPERKRELEGGLDLRFFQDRITFSATAYTNRTTDAILTVPVAPTTGFSATSANAAEIRNRGLELSLSTDIIKQQNGLTWSLAPNFSLNRNEVVSLSGAESIFLTGFTGTSSRAVQGQQLGALWGTRWARQTENNSYVLDANGFPTLAETEGVIGDPNPRWRGGLGTTLNFKGLSLNILFDHVNNLDVWNGTKGALYSYGTARDTETETTVAADQAATLRLWNSQTVAQRYQPNADGTYTFRGSIADYGGGPVVLDEQWYRNGLGNGFTGPAEQFVEHISYTRLREITLTYSLATAWFKERTKFQSVDLSLTGRNLALWTDYTGVDPETNLTGVSNGRGLDYFNNPSTRSMIFSIRFNY